MKVQELEGQPVKQQGEISETVTKPPVSLGEQPERYAMKKEFMATANNIPGKEAFFSHHVVRKFQITKVRNGSQNQDDPLTFSLPCRLQQKAAE